jgi:hypothetical protein
MLPGSMHEATRVILTNSEGMEGLASAIKPLNSRAPERIQGVHHLPTPLFVDKLVPPIY